MCAKLESGEKHGRYEKLRLRSGDGGWVQDRVEEEAV